MPPGRVPLRSPLPGLCAVRGLLSFLPLLLGLIPGLPGRATESVPSVPVLPLGTSAGFTVGLASNGAGIGSLRADDDGSVIEYLRAGEVLGRFEVRARIPAGGWIESRFASAEHSSGSLGRHGRWVEFRATSATGPSLASVSRWEFQPDRCRWTLRLRNAGATPVEIGDLAIPLPMRTDYVWDHEETFRRRLVRHAFVAGHGSLLFWQPVKGTGPILVMLPVDGTSLESFTSEGMDYAFGGDRYSVFVHSAASAERDPRGTWRQPNTRRNLAPGEELTCGFVFRRADSLDAVRRIAVVEGGVDVQVMPGMVVPRDLSAMVALRSRASIERVEAEYPGETVIEPAGVVGRGTRLYRVRFGRLGENLLRVRYGSGRMLPLEFFVTEPLETLIRKRAAFITGHQQHRTSAKWYDGLYSLWDRREPDGRNLLGPDHTAGQHPYAVSGSDDPSNSKCLLLAEKNVAWPDAREIESLEYFVEHFVWGRHQRRDDEQPYPYGIYGSDSWQQNRFATRDPLSEGISRPGGPSACRMWRTFDYPTYFALYYNLYRIARQRPDLTHYLDARGYLERAFGTARAYFEVPANIRMDGGWSFTGRVYWQYTTGNFHEKYLLPLIEALEREGLPDKAAILRTEWERKVKYFVYDNPWPFASEMPFDSTAYESTYAAARYALEHSLVPDRNLWLDRNRGQWYSHPLIDPARHREFLARQHAANLACRGTLEANYWSLGSDFRGCGSASYTLSYMSQMGGWAILDHALRFDPRPAGDLRLGYASMLSSWALLNSGDAASHHGYWTPGPAHDGAMSWGFQPRRIGTEWNPATRDLPRGAWPVCGEADHGLVAAVETARTIMFDDPIFGLIAFGGEVTGSGRELAVIPRDGVRQRFSAVLGRHRVHVGLDRDGFAREQPIRLDPGLDRLAFTLEDRGGPAHETGLSIEGLRPGRWRLFEGTTSKAVLVDRREPLRVRVHIPSGGQLSVELRR